MTTDRTFICPTRHAAQVYSNQTINLHTAPVFLYVFNHSWSFEQAWEPGFSYCDDYSCKYLHMHGMRSINYVHAIMLDNNYIAVECQWSLRALLNYIAWSANNSINIQNYF